MVYLRCWVVQPFDTNVDWWIIYIGQTYIYIIPRVLKFWDHPSASTMIYLYIIYIFIHVAKLQFHKSCKVYNVVSLDIFEDILGLKLNKAQVIFNKVPLPEPETDMFWRILVFTTAHSARQKGSSQQAKNLSCDWSMRSWRLSCLGSHYSEQVYSTVQFMFTETGHIY